MKALYILIILFAGVTQTSFAFTGENSASVQTASTKELSDKELKYAGFVPTVAVVSDYEIVRHGGRRTRSTKDYKIIFRNSEGKWEETSSVTIGKGVFQLFQNPEVGDTIQAYYNPASKSPLVVDEYEYSTTANTYDYRNLALYGGIGLVVLISLISTLKSFFRSLSGKEEEEEAVQAV